MYERVTSLLRPLYNQLIRPSLPSKIAVFNGIPVHGQIKLFDKTEQFPEYEEPACSSLRNHVSEGDDVVIVGGGLGVTSVLSARKTAPSGTVNVYEASISQIERVKETINLNKVSDQINLNHSIVGFYSDDSVKRYGQTGTASRIEPNKLPECDVLELDCEGAEEEIIRNIPSTPRIIIVETHEFLGVSSSDIVPILKKKGYKIIQREVENEEKGIEVITACL